MVKTPKRGIEKMLLDVTADTLGSSNRFEAQRQDEMSSQSMSPVKPDILPDSTRLPANGSRVIFLAATEVGVKGKSVG